MTSGWSPDFLQATAAGAPGVWQQQQQHPDDQQNQQLPSQPKDRQKDFHQVERTLLSLRQQEGQIEALLHQLSQQASLQSSQQNLPSPFHHTLMLPPSTSVRPLAPLTQQATPSLLTAGTGQLDRRTIFHDVRGAVAPGVHVRPQFPPTSASASSSLHLGGKEETSSLFLHPHPSLQPRPHDRGCLLLGTSSTTPIAPQTTTGTSPPALGGSFPGHDTHRTPAGGGSGHIPLHGNLLPGYSSSTSVHQESSADYPHPHSNNNATATHVPDPLFSPPSIHMRQAGFLGTLGGLSTLSKSAGSAPPTSTLGSSSTPLSSHIIQPAGVATASIQHDRNGALQVPHLPPVTTPLSPSFYSRPLGEPFSGAAGGGGKLVLGGLGDENFLLSAQQMDRKRTELLQERERIRQLQRQQEQLLKELTIQYQTHQQQALLQLKPPEGLHCGPAGKQALRQFFEQAYMLSRPPASLLASTDGTNASPTSIASSSSSPSSSAPTTSFLPSSIEPPALPTSPPFTSADLLSNLLPPLVDGSSALRPPPLPGSSSSTTPSPFLSYQLSPPDPSSHFQGGKVTELTPSPTSLSHTVGPFSTGAAGSGSGPPPFSLGEGSSSGRSEGKHGGEAASPMVLSMTSHQQYPTPVSDSLHTPQAWSVSGPNLPPSPSSTGGGVAVGGGSGSSSSVLPVLSNVSPALVVCKRWQATQGLQDPRAEAVVSLLRAMGVGRNVTYRGVFETTLRPKLILRIMKLRGLLRRYLEDDVRKRITTHTSSSSVSSGTDAGRCVQQGVLSPGEGKGLDLHLLRATVLPHLEDHADTVWREWLDEQSIFKKGEGGGGDRSGRLVNTQQTHQGGRALTIEAGAHSQDGGASSRSGGLRTATPQWITSFPTTTTTSSSSHSGKKRREGRGVGTRGEEQTTGRYAVPLFSPEEGQGRDEKDEEEDSTSELLRKKTRNVPHPHSSSSSSSASHQLDVVMSKKRKKKTTTTEGISDNEMFLVNRPPGNSNYSGEDFAFHNYRQRISTAVTALAETRPAHEQQHPAGAAHQEVYGAIGMLYTSIQRLGPMFQVRPLQPILAATLEAIQPLPIPPSVRKLLLSDTPASRDFYKVAHIRTKHFIWLRQPWRFFAEVSRHLDACVDILKASFLPSDLSSHAYTTNASTPSSSKRTRGGGGGEEEGKGRGGEVSRGGDYDIVGGSGGASSSFTSHGNANSRTHLGGAFSSLSSSVSGSSIPTSSASGCSNMSTAPPNSMQRHPPYLCETDSKSSTLSSENSSCSPPPPPPGVLLQQEIGILLNFVAGNVEIYNLLIFFIRLKFIHSLLPPGRYAIDLTSSSSSSSSSCDPLSHSSRRSSFVSSPPTSFSSVSSGMPLSSSSGRTPSATTGGGGVEKGWGVGGGSGGGRTSGSNQFIPIVPVESFSFHRRFSGEASSVSQTIIPPVSRNSYCCGGSNSPILSSRLSRGNSQSHHTDASISSLSRREAESSSSSSSSSASPPLPPSAASAPATFDSDTWTLDRSRNAKGGGGAGTKLIRCPSDGDGGNHPRQSFPSSDKEVPPTVSATSVDKSSTSPVTGESSGQSGEKKGKEKGTISGGFSKRFGEGGEGEGQKHKGDGRSGVSSSDISVIPTSTKTREGEGGTVQGSRGGGVPTEQDLVSDGRGKSRKGLTDADGDDEEEEDVTMTPPPRDTTWSRRSSFKDRVVKSHSGAGEGFGESSMDNSRLPPEKEETTRSSSFISDSLPKKSHEPGEEGAGGGEQDGDERNEDEEMKNKRKKAIESAYDSSRVWPQAECYWGYLRCLLAVSYRDRFNCDDLEMKTVDSCWNLILLVREVIRTGTNSLETARRRDELLSKPSSSSSSSSGASKSSAATPTVTAGGGGGGSAWSSSSSSSGNSGGSSSSNTTASSSTHSATSNNSNNNSSSGGISDISPAGPLPSSAEKGGGGAGFHIKSSNDLLDVCIICMHPVFLQAVAESLALSFYRPDFHPLIFRNQERIWRAFAVLGLSAPYVGLTKYLLESRPSVSCPTPATTATSTAYPSLPFPSSSPSTASTSLASSDVSMVSSPALPAPGSSSVCTPGPCGSGAVGSFDTPTSSQHQASTGIKKEERGVSSSSNCRGFLTLKGTPHSLSSSTWKETEKSSTASTVDVSSPVDMEPSRLGESDQARPTEATPQAPSSSVASNVNPPSCSPFRLPCGTVGGITGDKKSSSSVLTSERRVTTLAVGFPPCPPAGAVCTPSTGGSGWPQRATQHLTAAESVPSRASVRRQGVSTSSGEIFRSNSIPCKTPNEEQQQQHQKRRKGGGGLDIPLSKLIAYAAGSSVSTGSLGSSGVCTPCGATTTTRGGNEISPHLLQSRDTNSRTPFPTSQHVIEGGVGGTAHHRTGSMYWRSLTDLTSTHSFVSAYLPTFHNELYGQCTQSLQGFFDLSRDLAAVAQAVSASSADGSCSASAIEAALSAAISESTSSFSTIEPDLGETSRSICSSSKRSGGFDTQATSPFSSSSRSSSLYEENANEVLLFDQKQQQQRSRHLPRLKEKLKKLARDAVSICWPPSAASHSSPLSSSSSVSSHSQEASLFLPPSSEGFSVHSYSTPSSLCNRTINHGGDPQSISSTTWLSLPSDCFSAIINALNSVSFASSSAPISSSSSSFTSSSLQQQHGEMRGGHSHQHHQPTSGGGIVRELGAGMEGVSGSMPSSSLFSSGEGELLSVSTLRKGHCGAEASGSDGGIGRGGMQQDSVEQVRSSLGGDNSHTHHSSPVEMKKIRTSASFASTSSSLRTRGGGSRVEDRTDDGLSEVERDKTEAVPTQSREVKDADALPHASGPHRTPSAAGGSFGVALSSNNNTFQGPTGGGGRSSSSSSSFISFPTSSKPECSQTPYSTPTAPVMGGGGGGEGSKNSSSTGAGGGGGNPSNLSGGGTSSSSSLSGGSTSLGGLAAFCSRFRAAVEQCGDEGICQRLLVAGRTEVVLARLILTSLLPLTSTIEAFRPLHHSILRSISHQAHALVLLSSSTEELLDLGRRGSGRSCSQDHKLSLSKTGEADPASLRRPVKEQEESGETGETQPLVAESGASKAKGEEGDLSGKLSRKNSITAGGGGGGEDGLGGRVDVSPSLSSSSSFSSHGKNAVATPRVVCGGGSEGGGEGAGGQGGAGGIGRPRDFLQNQGQLDWLFAMSLKCFVRLAVTPQGTQYVEDNGLVRVSLPESPLSGGGSGGGIGETAFLASASGTSLQPSVLMEITKILNLLASIDTLFLQYFVELLKAPSVARALGTRGPELLRQAWKLGAQYTSKSRDVSSDVNSLMLSRSFEEAHRLYRLVDITSSGDKARLAGGGGAGGFLSSGEAARGEGGGKSSVGNSISSRIPCGSGE